MSGHRIRYLFAAVAFVVLCGTEVYGGEMFVIGSTVEIGGGASRTFKPNAPMAVSFHADSYTYGSNEFGYIFFSIVPNNERIDKVDKSRLKQWKCYRMLLKVPGQSREKMKRFNLSFQAPSKPGQYKLIYNKIPWFATNPLDSADQLDLLQETTQSVQLQTEQAILRYPGYFYKIVDFAVSNKPQPEDTFHLYLRVNNSAPVSANVKGGLVDRPLEVSWFIGNEFKLPKENVLFRYMLWPDDNDWTAWTKDTNVRFHFLPKGVHEFRAQAMYQDQKQPFQSAPAQFQFVLDDNLVTRLVKGPKGYELEGKPITTVAFDNVYARSRALIIGVWQFDDKTRFQSFPKEKIQKDIDTMSTALGANGFEVTTLFKDRLSREEIYTALENLIGQASENDRLFVYFSSHGFADIQRSSDGYIATSDCEFNRPSVKCLRLGDIEIQARRALEGKRVRQVFIAVDSCFSGLGIITKAAGAPNLAKLAANQGIFMMTAGMADQLAEIDPRLNMSTFTHYLARGLSGEARLYDKGKNGVMTLTELLLYVQYNVAEQTSSRQIPMLGRVMGDGEMLFRPKTGQQ